MMNKKLALASVVILTGIDSEGDEMVPTVFSTEEAATHWIENYGDEDCNYELTACSIDELLLEGDDEPINSEAANDNELENA